MLAPLISTRPGTKGQSPESPTDSGAAWFAAQERAVVYLLNHQNADGGWGGGESVRQSYAAHCGKPDSADHEKSALVMTSTVEETALAAQSLIQFTQDHGATAEASRAIINSIEFLVRSVDDKIFEVPWPIGFYFAKLWYHEQLYPLIFTASALGHFLAACESGEVSVGTVGQNEQPAETVTMIPPR